MKLTLFSLVIIFSNAFGAQLFHHLPESIQIEALEKLRSNLPCHLLDYKKLFLAFKEKENFRDMVSRDVRLGSIGSEKLDKLIKEIQLENSNDPLCKGIPTNHIFWQDRSRQTLFELATNVAALEKLNLTLREQRPDAHILDKLIQIAEVLPQDDMYILYIEGSQRSESCVYQFEKYGDEVSAQDYCL